MVVGCLFICALCAFGCGFMRVLAGCRFIVWFVVVGFVVIGLVDWLLISWFVWDLRLRFVVHHVFVFVVIRTIGLWGLFVYCSVACFG